MQPAPNSAPRPSMRPMMLVFIVGGLILFGWPYLQNAIWPPRVVPVKPSLDSMSLLTGSVAIPGDLLKDFIPSREATQHMAALVAGEAPPEKVEPVKIEPPKKETEPSELMAMGDEGTRLRVLFNTRGGSVQQLVLRDFQEASREGLPVVLPDGSPKSLHLIPGVKIVRTSKFKDQDAQSVPVIQAGPITPDIQLSLSESSYLMYHYQTPEDDRPIETLGNRVWKATTRKVDDRQEVVFETELQAPYFVTIRKIFSLGPNDYHLGLRVEIDRKPGQAGTNTPFRYQLSGPVGLPIEGEWYTPTQRNALVGWVDSKNRASRDIETAQEVRNLEGGNRHEAKGRELQYAGVSIQFFASMLAVDNEQPDGGKTNFLEASRATPVGTSNKEKAFLDDITVRVITQKLDLKQPIRQQYLLYQGPIKVRLLKQLDGSKAVDEALVDKYAKTLHLSTMTDSPMPNWIGSFANAIFWTDLVVTTTNMIHGLLGWLYHIIPNLGVCIILITFLVRGLLHPLSRRQAKSAAVMQQKMAALAPEIKKLQEKYPNDFQRLNQEKTKLMMSNGINPLTQMGGCLLLLAQMPIFMGLYYALQESVFFRLEGFLWIPNLSAPDMLVRWGENIPFISDTASLGSLLYLGPYLNILPLIAVLLMLYQQQKQQKMMPPAMDEQQAMQQNMMKYMMIFFAFMFYKTAAGLCIYFICSTTWGLIERRLAPKPVPIDPNAVTVITPGSNGQVTIKGKKGAKVIEPPKSNFRAWLEKKMEEARKK